MNSNNKPKAEIIGADGNIYNILGIAGKALKDNDMASQAEEMYDRVTNSKSYSEALGIIMDYVEPVGVSDETEDEDLDFEY